MNREELDLENSEILQYLDSIVNRYNLGILTLNEMKEEMKTKKYEEYLLSISLEINSPMEDAFRFRYITLIEMFKRVSLAIKDTYFLDNPVPYKEKYYAMNMCILVDEDAVEKVNGIIEERNELAHIWLEGFLDNVKLKPKKKINNVKFLYEVLKKYKAFVDSKKNE